MRVNKLFWCLYTTRWKGMADCKVNGSDIYGRMKSYPKFSDSSILYTYNFQWGQDLYYMQDFSIDRIGERTKIRAKNIEGVHKQKTEKTRGALLNRSIFKNTMKMGYNMEELQFSSINK